LLRLSDLRAAVAAVSQSGQKAEELNKSVDDLTKHVAEKGGKEADKHVSDMKSTSVNCQQKGNSQPSDEDAL
jgi:hypothetical protein